MKISVITAVYNNRATLSNSLNPTLLEFVISFKVFIDYLISIYVGELLYVIK